MKSDAKLCKECLEAQEKSGLDICRLIEDLEKIKLDFTPKKKELSDNDKIYLCLSLCLDENGARLYTFGQIAYYLYHREIPIYNKKFLQDPELETYIKTTKSEMSKRINSYIKELLDIHRKPIWEKVVYLLHKKGYSKQIDNIKNSVNKTSVAMYLIQGEITESKLMSILKEKGFLNIKVRKVV